MSPEQAREGDLTGQSDIFSLGVVSYQLLTGKTPLAARDPDACILQQGTIGGAFYILVSGEVAIQKDGKDIAVLREGECFGEIGYLTEGRRSATVVATQAATVMKISAPVRDWASLPTQLRLGKVFQQVLIERLIESGKALAKALP